VGLRSWVVRGGQAARRCDPAARPTDADERAAGSARPTAPPTGTKLNIVVATAGAQTGHARHKVVDLGQAGQVCRSCPVGVLHGLCHRGHAMMEAISCSINCSVCISPFCFLSVSGHVGQCCAFIVGSFVSIFRLYLLLYLFSYCPYSCEGREDELSPS
jgi:hypothetical protein